ncbi:uncharacterized protein [Mycetomoellerius zeteki]|uniref:uncharacterized protein n=1 Tax=Mycetomoellerius zeteki TaxID=64791 RepID=UPI00084E8A47|nr:PREDICTED: uncharacterized protein LOC108722443 [Trachymyrmex zeteki]
MRFAARHRDRHEFAAGPKNLMNTRKKISKRFLLLSCVRCQRFSAKDLKGINSITYLVEHSYTLFKKQNFSRYSRFAGLTTPPERQLLTGSGSTRRLRAYYDCDGRLMNRLL